MTRINSLVNLFHENLLDFLHLSIFLPPLTFLHSACLQPSLASSRSGKGKGVPKGANTPYPNTTTTTPPCFYSILS